MLFSLLARELLACEEILWSAPSSCITIFISSRHSERVSAKKVENFPLVYFHLLGAENYLSHVVGGKFFMPSCTHNLASWLWVTMCTWHLSSNICYLSRPVNYNVTRSIHAPQANVRFESKFTTRVQDACRRMQNRRIAKSVNQIDSYPSIRTVNWICKQKRDGNSRCAQFTAVM